MILTKLTLENVGPFRGRNEVPLSPPDDEHSIVLIGGKNGAGKTTIFNAIQIALYGQGWKGRQTKKDYHQDLDDLIHDHDASAIQPNQAAVELEFEFGHRGEVETYEVRRSWERTQAGISEDLTLEQNGSLLDGMEADQWRDFLRDLVPPGVSSLFFFDGEKIKDLASTGETRRRAFEDALESLLGLDTVDRLRADLGILLSREFSNGERSDLKEKVEETRQEIQRLEETEAGYERRYRDLEDRLDHLRSELDQVEEQIRNEGGSFADKREDLKQRRAWLESEIEFRNERIRDLAKSLLPVAMAPGYADRLRDQLESEREHLKWRSSVDVLRDNLTDLAEELGERHPDLTDEDTPEKLLGDAVQILEERGETDLGDIEIRHGLGADEDARMVAAIEEALGPVTENLLELSADLEELNRERSEVESMLQSVPDDSQIAPLVDEAKEINKEIGETEHELTSLDEEISRVENAKGKQESRLEKLYDRIKDLNKDSRAVDLAGKARDALEDYYDRLVEEKLDDLNAHLQESFHFLASKGDYYETIRVDSDLNVEIVTKGGSVRPQQRLSAGERQIFAVSLLWALAKTSNRQLPFIVDTPLGRLDQTHRDHLVDRFFPNASDQVVILSTDTEVDEASFDQLQPHIGRAYHLAYDADEAATEIEEGYFWTETTEVVA